MSLEAQTRIQENISSFIDDELGGADHEALVSHLHENDDHKEILGRYCVMSDAIKRNLPETMSHNLLGRVQAALESEPPLLAPAPNHVANELPEAEIVKLPTKASNNEFSFKPAFGFGIAATVTIAAVLGFQLFTQTEDLPNQATIASTNTNVAPDAPVVALKAAPATQQIQIVTAPVTPSSASPFVVSESSSDRENATYAEQSLIDDGQWTRITQVGGIPLRNNILSGRAESHVQFKLQGNSYPFARSVKLE